MLDAGVVTVLIVGHRLRARTTLVAGASSNAGYGIALPAQVAADVLLHDGGKAAQPFGQAVGIAKVLQ